MLCCEESVSAVPMSIHYVVCVRLSACWGSFWFKRGGHFLFLELKCSQSVIGPLANLDPIAAEMCNSSAQWSWTPRRLDLKPMEAIVEMLQWPVSYDSLRNKRWPLFYAVWGSIQWTFLWCKPRRHPGDMAEGEVVGDLPVGGQWRVRGIKKRGWDGSPALSFRFGDLHKGHFPEALEFSSRYR